MIIKIITGLAGGGKSTVLDAFEDMGYYCIDNLPPNLLKEFINLYERKSSELETLAVVMDLRLGVFFEDVAGIVDELKSQGYDIQILFVEAQEEVLMKRFGETRRLHPLELKGDRRSAIREEKKRLEELRTKADRIIDTSTFNRYQLKKAIQDSYRKNKNEFFQIVVTSFGIKHGDLSAADFQFDLRFLPNPFYVDDLKVLTGHDAAVQRYIMDSEVSQNTLQRIKDLLDTVIPPIQESGRHTLHVGFGCTGGHHRSVTFAALISDYLSAQGYQVLQVDRDVNQNA